MAPKTVQSRAARAWAIANRDHGIVAARELLALGYTWDAIRHRRKTGRLHRQARGVYSVGTPRITRYGRWMVAIKACGRGACLSHFSAAVLWGIVKREAGRITITVPRGRNPRVEAVKVHRRVVGVTEHHGIPVTDPLQTLIDLGTILPRDRLERAINEADALDLLRADTLHDALRQRRGEPGVAQLLDILDRDAFVLTDTELEALLVPLARRAGIESLETQVMVDGNRVDFYARDPGFVIECQSLRYHRTPAKQRLDAIRQQRHAKAGTLCVPFTHYQVAYEPNDVVATLVGVIRTLTAPRAAG